MFDQERTRMVYKLEDRRILHPIGHNHGFKNCYMFWCPGCNCGHWFGTRDEQGWQFDGNMEKPTVSPSIACTWTEGEARVPKCCHLFVQDGLLKYLNDCTHKLCGQTIPMVAF